MSRCPLLGHAAGGAAMRALERLGWLFKDGMALEFKVALELQSIERHSAAHT